MSLKKELPILTIVGFITASLVLFTILTILSNIVINYNTVGQKLLELNAKEGVANAVTTVVVYFRGFDTLGEVTVLFLASLGVGFILNTKGECKREEIKSNFMLSVASEFLFPVIVLFGAYIVFYGHLGPGGGFQGGTIVASGVILMLVSKSKFEIKHKIIAVVEALSGASYVVIGLIGLLVFDRFLSNILPNNIANMGMLISGGIIPIVYILVGLKVGSEMSAISQTLIKGCKNA